MAIPHLDRCADPLRMAITNGNEFGGSLPAPTTSPVNFLATNDADVFLGRVATGLLGAARARKHSENR